MHVDEPHSWNLSVKEAQKIQKNLARKVRIQKILREPNIIAGFDVAYDIKKRRLFAGMVVLNYPDLTVIDEITANEAITFPYVPGYLSFREAPALIKLIKNYQKNIDVFMFDGHGIAHPRDLGIAAHVGVLVDRPSIGCAKKKLIGIFEMPGPNKGDSTGLFFNKNLVGRVLRSKDNVNPIFVSVGHAVNLDDAVDLVLNCCTRYRLPEPTRLADLAVAQAKRSIH